MNIYLILNRYYTVLQYEIRSGWRSSGGRAGGRVPEDGRAVPSHWEDRAALEPLYRSTPLTAGALQTRACRSQPTLEFIDTDRRVNNLWTPRTQVAAVQSAHTYSDECLSTKSWLKVTLSSLLLLKCLDWREWTSDPLLWQQPTLHRKWILYTKLMVSINGEVLALNNITLLWKQALFLLVCVYIGNVSYRANVW